MGKHVPIYPEADFFVHTNAQSFNEKSEPHVHK